MGHRWKHRPTRFSHHRYVCQKCWTTLVGCTRRPPNDLLIRPPVTSRFRDQPETTCEMLVVYALQDL